MLKAYSDFQLICRLTTAGEVVNFLTRNGYFIIVTTIICAATIKDLHAFHEKDHSNIKFFKLSASLTEFNLHGHATCTT
jgi:hypothetical protein